MMHLPSEIEAMAVIPALRSMLAKELIGSGRMNQSEVGALLGITQSAVSNYVTGVRARNSAFLDIPYVRERIGSLATDISGGNDNARVAQVLSELTQFIRKNRMMCEMHRAIDPGMDVDGCHICEE